VLVREILPSLNRHAVRSFLFDSHAPLQIFLHVADHPVPTEEITHRSQVACLITKKPETLVLVLGYKEDKIVSIRLSKIRSPPIIRADYEALVLEADIKRKKYMDLRVARGRKSTEKLSKQAKRRQRHKK
jgi:hypothetical protein